MAASVAEILDAAIVGGVDAARGVVVAGVDEDRRRAARGGGHPPFDVAQAGEVLVEALPVRGAEPGGELDVAAIDEVEHRLVPCARADRQRAEQFLPNRHRVQAGRHRSVGRRDLEARDVHRRDFPVALARAPANGHVQALLGLADGQARREHLVDRRAVLGKAAAADGRGLNAARQPRDDSRLALLADRALHVDAAEDEDLVLHRLERGEDRAQHEVRLGSGGRPLAQHGAARLVDGQEASGRRRGGPRAAAARHDLQPRQRDRYAPRALEDGPATEAEFGRGGHQGWVSGRVRKASVCVSATSSSRTLPSVRAKSSISSRREQASSGPSGRPYANAIHLPT